jgi:hypothetical protein
MGPLTARSIAALTKRRIPLPRRFVDSWGEFHVYVGTMSGAADHHRQARGRTGGLDSPGR